MRVVITDRRFPGRDLYGDLVDAVDGELVYGSCATEADAVERCAGADVIVVGFTPITEAVMDAAGDPRLIMRHATGYDNIDVRAATARGIPVSNVPGYAPRDIASPTGRAARRGPQNASSRSSGRSSAGRCTASRSRTSSTGRSSSTGARG